MFSAMLDPLLWNRLKFRDDDIVISSWPKSGTTWAQQIVAQLVFNGEADLFGQSISPWIEARNLRQVQMAEAQEHRRILKSHLAAGYLPIFEKVKYIYVARHPIEVLLSWHRHRCQMSDPAYRILNLAAGLEEPRIERPNPDPDLVVSEWIEKGDELVGALWENVQSWWDLRNRSHVKLIHYAALSADLAAVIAEIADFLEIPPTPELVTKVEHHCRRDHMRHLAMRDAKLRWAFADKGYTFVNSNEGGPRKSELSEAVVNKLEYIAQERLSSECKDWLCRPSCSTVKSIGSVRANAPLAI